jgi:hypothetical protein
VPVTIVKAGERVTMPRGLAVAGQPRLDQLRPH